MKATSGPVEPSFEWKPHVHSDRIPAPQAPLAATALASGETARLTPLELVANWCQLSRADEVTVCRDRRKVAAGRVDMVALDGSVFWIIQEDGKGRAMVHWKDGVAVWRRAAKARGPRHYAN